MAPPKRSAQRAGFADDFDGDGPPAPKSLRVTLRLRPDLLARFPSDRSDAVSDTTTTAAPSITTSTVAASVVADTSPTTTVASSTAPMLSADGPQPKPRGRPGPKKKNKLYVALSSFINLYFIPTH